MYEKINGKKLLVVGSDAINVDIVHVAHELGIYVIVVDGIADRTKTPAKNVADEAWDIDYFDTDIIVKRCVESGVEGVFAAYSEFRVLAACRIANKLGTPFYATEEQILLTRNKRRFKEECVRYGILTPKDYCASGKLSEEEKEKIEYPVIVKPTDNAGRKGISVCYDRIQLERAIVYAKQHSQCKELIIEEYLEGTELCALYTIVDGKASLSCLNGKYIMEDQERKTGLCEFVLTPVNFYDRYIKETDKNIQEFLKGISAKNGFAFFQGMVTDKKICIFEMGYRVNGNNEYRFIEKLRGINFMKMLISYSLCGTMGDDIKKDNPEFEKYISTLLLYAHSGRIERMEYEKVLCHPQIEEAMVYAWEGKEIAEDGTTGQNVLSFRLMTDTIEEQMNLIKYIQKNVVIEDATGKNMMFRNFDAGRLLADKFAK